MDLTTLKKLGLSDKEIKIYLSILEYGAMSIRDLADLIGLNRGTTYDTLKNLQKMGLVSYFHQDTRKKFSAEEPEKLNNLMREREGEIREAKENIKKIIPELKLLKDKDEHKPTAKFFEGRNGIKQILEDVLFSFDKEKEKEYFIYSATKASEDINNAYPKFTEDRIKKKISVKAISLSEGGKTHGLDERRWLGTNDESATFIIIYFGKCAYVSRDAKGIPVGVIIENVPIYETQKNIFLKLWSLLK